MTIPIESMDIEWALMQRIGSGSVACPRFTPTAWWECDVAELTGAGYLVEFEIKMSRSDFRRDSRKSGYVRTDPEDWKSSKKTTKHEMCESGHKRAPNRFYFVTPEKMLAIEDIPKWAGLIEVGRYRDIDWPHCTVIKRAPLIHKEKRATIGQQIGQVPCGRAVHMWNQQYYRRDSARRKKILSVAAK